VGVSFLLVFVVVQYGRDPSCVVGCDLFCLLLGGVCGAVVSLPVEICVVSMWIECSS
jgi:hypothetical protein